MMLLFLALSTFFSVASTSQVPILSPAAQSQNLEAATSHAAPIFNALHGALRQWDSSLHHNGMSFFRATIPVNTLLYHGTHSAEPIKGMEWLALEIEHAENFARTRPPGRGPPRPPPGEGPPDDGGPGKLPPPPFFDPDNDSRWEEDRRAHMPEGWPPEDWTYGYLHTYRTRRPITNLLYIDGMSAGKTNMGTLDTQDFILLQDTNLTGLPGFGDWQRALHLCDLTTHIDGYIRMEAGFEIILCNFEKDLEFVSAFQRPNVTEAEKPGESMSFAEYARGVAERYHGIGGGRVLVDYSSMVSAYFYPVNLTNPNASRSELPRLPTDDFEGLKKVKQDILSHFSPDTERNGNGIDWQGITDMIVTRFAGRLGYLALNTSTETQMLTELEFMLSHAVDFKKPNFTEGKELCTLHYLVSATPMTTKADELIYAAVTSVTRKICGTLFDVWESLRQNQDSARRSVEPERVKAEAKSQLEKLMQYLDWSTWLECGKCAWDEICYVAIWPWGGTEDHKNPGCVSMYEIGSRRGYWDFGW